MKKNELKDFVNSFDIRKPDWSKLPAGFPDCDLNGLTSEEVGLFNAVKTIWEMSKPEKPKARSRVWDDPGGYQYLAVWQNAALLRELVRKFTLTLPLRQPLSEHRLRDQMNDAARSVKRNIEEGWKRATTGEYLQFLSYSQGSLEELKGDLRDCRSDGFLRSVPGSILIDKGFDLRVLKGVGKGLVKGEPTDPGHPYCRPLRSLNPRNLTFEELAELANKTDYLLRKLVESLEKKLSSEQKYYQVEKARIRSNLKVKR